MADYTFTLTCDEHNDVYRCLLESGVACRRFDSTDDAVQCSAPGGALLVLAHGYPGVTTQVAADALEQAEAKRLSLYIEYPAALPGIEIGEPRGTEWERAVVASDGFGDALPRLRILSVSGCRFVPAQSPDPLIVAARVAGFDEAVFGLPEQSYPLLFETPGRRFVAATKLSNFITGRYAPADAWTVIWQYILRLLRPGFDIELRWTPRVRPSHGRADSLPDDAESIALRRGVTWFPNSRLLTHTSRKPEIDDLLAREIETTETPPEDSPVGDGSHGILEGFGSPIAHDGSQRQRTPQRSDCTAESAMALAMDWRVNRDDTSRRVAANLLDFLYFTSPMHSGPVRGNPEHPAFGLVAWGAGNRPWERAFYGDDAARVLLGTIVASACLDTDDYDERMMRVVLANFRTTGTLGFRGERIDIPDLEANGWKHYHEAATVHPAPHFESYLWACNLWAYSRTGYQPLLERTKTAIRMTMERYPNDWKWANGIAQERARMLLCLAWLIRVEDKPEHRGWLRIVADDVISNQQPCGAIREQLGGTDRGWAGSPQSNEAYGTAEAALIQQNGDPVADMLYTCNFAFLGFHEAAAATGDARLKLAEDRLADFLCRIQIRADDIPYLDGGWFRAFDYGKWDYWASSSDLGWGAWSIESGWTQGWITTVMGLRALGTTVWDLTQGVRIDRHFDKVRSDMAVNQGGPWTGEPW